MPDEETICQAEQVLYFDDGLVMPGIVDTHTFYWLRGLPSGGRMYHR